MNEIVSLRNIDKSYTIANEKLQVLKHINLTITKGDYIAILGASGSGKSTLMNVIGCMDTADAGEYCLDGVDVGSCSEHELSVLRNEKIGFIFQKYHLIPQYTILQNVILPLLIQRKSRLDATSIAEEYIKMVGLWERISHKPNELSGGQQQRMAIARALVTTPALLLADEPTGALDSQTGKEILSLFQKLNDMGNTIIMITHDTKVAEHSKRIFHLNDGVLN
ncbi:MAG: macrolide ABC transporter ATP-binding protein [Firmicutes bacterium HGW-Firmicutes-7]|nr:MAG: macrolide ABC transporter ATP-binding protein [Firmicutes bacterium HGW-Firmicutes-7]